MCSHPSASIISSFKGGRLSHLFFRTQKELAAVDWKELCPANFCWLLPKAHSGCCVVLVAEGRWLISLQQQQQRARNRENPSAFPLLLPLCWQNKLKILHPRLLGFIYFFFLIPGLAAPPAHRNEGKASAEGSPAWQKSHFPHAGSLTQPNPLSVPLCRNEEIWTSFKEEEQGYI